MGTAKAKALLLRDAGQVLKKTAQNRLTLSAFTGYPVENTVDG